ncbi:MAG: chromosome segregation protein SMC [Acidimicrobiales bacterium]|nr:chromosome segregation protein SMC [Acidimicrobiales bacterium]
MHLKTLTMKGFKSFADTVDLELEEGVTVVVGPNGSGKSNVVDAIAWVLGAQAPSSVRSQKMDDVIFAGTAKRPALGRAEVSLVIDNSDGLLPVDFTEVQITRTLFRNGDSEYSMNGTPCRLLDIQDMLSDSGVGRTQHVIISQGQIDAVLNARPEERRLIIEEAAGVLKYRKRREKAQRRLVATEANLTRVKDLLRELRRQLRPLEKQADAARRHGDVVAELHACQLYLAGRQVESLRAKLNSQAQSRVELKQRDKDLRELLASLDAEIAIAETEVSAQGAVDLGDALARLEGLSQRARGTDELLSERSRSIAKERQATIDGDVLAALRADAAQLTSQLDEVEVQIAELQPRFTELERIEASLTEDRSSFDLALLSASGEGAEVAAAGRAAEVRGELAALRSSIDRATSELDGISTRLAALAERKTELTERTTSERERLDAAVALEQQLVSEADLAATRHTDAQARLAALREQRAEAEANHRSADARVRALAEALDGARAAAGTDALADVPGVVGTILDVVEVEPGWEAAVEAALGSVLSAVVVESPENARQALERFATGPGNGSVIALGAHAPLHSVQTSEMSILQRVRSDRPEVQALLGRVLADVDVVDGDWRVALDRSLAHNGRTVVTSFGDHIGGGLWRIGSTGVGATRSALEDAERQLEVAAVERTECDRQLTQCAAEVDQLAAADKAAASALDANDADLNSTTEALHQIEAKIRQIDIESDTLGSQQTELKLRLERETSRAGELDALLPGLESAEEQSAERSRELEAMRAALEERHLAKQNLRTDLEVKAAALDERRGVLRRRLGEVQDRLERLAVEESQAESRRVELDRLESLTRRLQTIIQENQVHLTVHLEARREERRQQSAVVRELTEKLDSSRTQRSTAETELREMAERIGRIDIEEAETRLRLETTTEMLRRDLDVSPEGALAAPHPELDEGITPAARARELERDLKIMGPINPLALQEFEALQERHEFLNEQLDDIRSSRRELNKVIKAIDEEIVTVFAAAYADVADNFTTLFERLFPGGQGGLKLTDPNNLLETGIEVSAKPSGKNVKKLSLLSGGERSLTALAFLFAVFRSRPSPFYVMDEVEAALDDVNLHRFLSLVEEFRSEAQLVIVSHQKRTMEAADSLYGVTMEPGGSSKVVSERSEVERNYGTGATRTGALTSS